MANKDLELEQLKLGEIDKAKWLLKNNCSESELEKKLDDLRHSDAEILSMYSTEKMKEAIASKIQNNKESNEVYSEKSNKKVFKFPSSFFTNVKPFVAVAAAVLVCSVLIPFHVMQNKSISSSENFSVRVKGSNNPSLFLYKYEDGHAVKLNEHDKIREGDTIQISYIAGQNTEGMIFSIDGNGVLTQHFPDKKAVSGTLGVGKEVALNFSYKLDAAPRFEKFYFVSGKEPFYYSDLEISLETGIVTSIDKKNLTITEFYLEKESKF